MAKQTSKAKHFKKFSVIENGIKINVRLERFDKQFHQAQFELDSRVMTDMNSYMPKNTGSFINVTKQQSDALAGTGIVVAGTAPMGRFLYGGKVMIDPVTQSPWARLYAEKILTEKDLTFSNPNAKAKWFEVAKKKHGKEWVGIVKKTAGGG